MIIESNYHDTAIVFASSIKQLVTSTHNCPDRVRRDKELGDRRTDDTESLDTGSIRSVIAACDLSSSWV
ncbi:Hypothetical protein MVR_LOCUS40 [uncultured virus]|nr:Hypothetical protein MVR_LOCUS40 [uncultured virus]